MSPRRRIRVVDLPKLKPAAACEKCVLANRGPLNADGRRIKLAASRDLPGETVQAPVTTWKSAGHVEVIVSRSRLASTRPGVNHGEGRGRPLATPLEGGVR
jgi:hypothetical protein